MRCIISSGRAKTQSDYIILKFFVLLQNLLYDYNHIVYVSIHYIDVCIYSTKRTLGPHAQICLLTNNLKLWSLKLMYSSNVYYKI